MTVRRVLPVALLVTGALAVPAHAAPRKVCHLLGPNSGFLNSRGVPYSHPLHIRSADIASNRTHLTAVVRVKDLGDPLLGPTGESFGFKFSRHAEENYFLTAMSWQSGEPVFSAGMYSEPFDPQPNQVSSPTYTTFGRVKGVVDVAKDEVRITVPLSLLRKHPAHSLKRGAKVTYLSADTATWYGVERPEAASALPPEARTGVGYSGAFTYGSTRITYTLGAPSCVAVGR
jgi:hypothetical protein